MYFLLHCWGSFLGNNRTEWLHCLCILLVVFNSGFTTSRVSPHFHTFKYVQT